MIYLDTHVVIGLYEIKRIKQHGAEIADTLAEAIRLEICILPFELVIRTALQFK